MHLTHFEQGNPSILKQRQFPDQSNFMLVVLD